MEISNWLSVISIVFIILSFYFTLSFIENLHKDDERITRQSKTAAIICLGLALLIPVLFNLIFH